MKILKVTEKQYKLIVEHQTKKELLQEVVNNATDTISINISRNKFGQDLFYLNFNLRKDDGNELTKKYPKSFYENRKKPNSYFMMAPIGAKDAFFNGVVIRNILQTLAVKGYSVPSQDDLKKQADIEVKLDVLTPDEKLQAKESYDNLVVKVLTNLNDQKMRELISKASNLRVTQDIKDAAFGHKYSGKNVLRALAIKPDATFVATRKNWLANYNRMVKPDATKIVLVIPASKGNYDQSKAEKDLGVTKQLAYQSAQMKHKFDIAAQSDESGSSYMNKIFYDISDTYLIPGLADNDGDLSKFDKVMNEPGLLDNLQGLLNQAAINMKGVNLSPEDKAKIGAKDTSDKNVMVFSRVFNYLKDLSIGDRLLTPVVDSLIKLDPKDDNSVYKVINSYFMNVAFDRAASDRQLKANIATAGTLAMDELAPTALVGLLNSNPDILKLTKPDIVNVFDKIMELQNKVISARNVIDNPTIKTNESENITESTMNSPEDLLALFGYSMSDLENKENQNDELLNEYYHINNNINNIFQLIDGI